MSKSDEWYNDIPGMEFECRDRNTGALVRCVVSNFDYDFGFTVQDLETKEYITCYRGPEARVKGFASAARDIAHRKYMAAVAKLLRSGTFTHERDDFAYAMSGHNNGADSGISSAMCAFAQ